MDDRGYNYVVSDNGDFGNSQNASSLCVYTPIPERGAGALRPAEGLLPDVPAPRAYRRAPRDPRRLAAARFHLKASSIAD